jgi:hypothetical protein
MITWADYDEMKVKALLDYEDIKADYERLFLGDREKPEETQESANANVY